MIKNAFMINLINLRIMIAIFKNYYINIKIYVILIIAYLVKL